MPSFEVVNLSVIWCIGLLAVILTVNARGALRALFSAIITIGIFAVACCLTFLKVQGYENYVMPWAVSEKDSLSVDEEDLSMRESKAGENGYAERYVSAAQKLIGEGLDLTKQIESLNALPRNISEPEREKAESKALAIRNSAAHLNSRAISLFHSQTQRESYSHLVHATENLRLAGYSMHVYTTLENADERQVQFEQGKSRAAAAKKELEASRAELGMISGK